MLGTETLASTCAFQADMLSFFSLDNHRWERDVLQLVCTENCSILRFVLCILGGSVLLRGLASQARLNTRPLARLNRQIGRMHFGTCLMIVSQCRYHVLLARHEGQMWRTHEDDAKNTSFVSTHVYASQRRIEVTELVEIVLFKLASSGIPDGQAKTPRHYSSS